MKSKSEVPQTAVKSYTEYLESIGFEKKEARSRYEISDPVPVAPPLGYKEGPDLVEIIRRQIRMEALKAEGGIVDETFEESDDFDTGDEDDAELSGFEDEFEPPVYVKAPTAAEEKVLETPKEPEPPAEGSSKPVEVVDRRKGT